MNILVLCWLGFELILVLILYLWYHIHNNTTMGKLLKNQRYFITSANIIVKGILIVLGAITVYGIMSFVYNACGYPNPPYMLWQWMATDSIITIATLLTTTATIYIALYNTWYSHLPKRISVAYVFHHSESELKSIINNLNKELEIINYTNSNTEIINEIDCKILNINKGTMYKNERELSNLFKKSEDLNRDNKLLKEKINFLNELIKIKNINNKYLLVYACLDAELASEADRRQWAQQIGKQMNDGKELSFYPYFDMLPNNIEYVTLDNNNTDVKKLVNNYMIIMYLKFLPLADTPNEVQGKIWLDNDSNTPGNIEKKFKIIENGVIKKSQFEDYQNLKDFCNKIQPYIPA